LKIGSQLIETYCSVTALNELEVDLLYYLVAGRICISLCNSAKALKLRPDSAYIGISAKPAENLLNFWLESGPIKVTNAFRRAAGFPTKSSPSLEFFNASRQKFLSSALSLSYEQPIVMEKAAFQYMYAANGTSFLDAYNNIMLVGHAHPHVTEKGFNAMRKLNTNTRYHYEALYHYSEKLVSYFPDNLSKIFLVNSGSAATDLAIRLAKNYTGKRKIAALEYGYHGNTVSGISISHYKHRNGIEYPETLICPLPHPSRSYKNFEDNPGNKYIEATNAILRNSSDDLAAFFAEPIVGCGGQVPLPKDYLKQVYSLVRQFGGVCVSDEVQVGFGRLGSHFWGFELYDVVPDIVVLGKPIGNGHPMGAVICTPEIAESFSSGPEFFSSFGGNPVSCTIGEAVLEVIENENLQSHAWETGNYLIKELIALQAEFPHISEVRGSGMFLGVELMHSNKIEATSWAKAIKNGLRKKNVLIGTDGPKDNVLKIKPPLPFNSDNANELTEKIHDLLKTIHYS
jgi:4-aminobutyrate aminotransferase-like enzyme